MISLKTIVLTMTVATAVSAAAATDLASKTYEWTDSTGTVQTSNLYDLATNPDQIAQLMIKVYTDPEIPGQTYIDSGTDSLGNSLNMPAGGGPYDGRINYNARKPGWIGWSGKTVQQPVDGMTLIM